MAVRIRDLGHSPGIHAPGPSNSVLDVPGVHVSQVTLPTSNKLQNKSNACKGVTIICPRPPKDFYTFTFNGNGEVTGGRQMADWGFCNMPIGLTNSTSLGTVYDGIWDWVLDQQDRLGWDSLTRSRLYGTPVVGETADWQINCELRHGRLPADAVKQCLAGLRARPIGPKASSPAGRRTDPLSSSSSRMRRLSTSQLLQRLARHATAGLARVGSYGIGRNFSGDIFLALSTAEHGPEQLDRVRPRHQNPSQVFVVESLKNESIDTDFYAAAEAVEEAILNCMVGSRDGKIAMDGSKVDGIPVDRVRQILEQHLVKM